VLSCLEVEHAGGWSLGDVLGGGDLVKSCITEKIGQQDAVRILM
jgi:hypothetical protein